jgi:transmembrane sensor
VQFTAEKRGVRLVRGEAHFAVMKNASRPFVVSAGGVDVQAVGTAFAVRFDSKQIDVLVTEGRVAVQSPPPPAPGSRKISDASVESIYLDAGARVALPVGLPSVHSAKVEPVTPTQVAQALAWRGKRIEFAETPLVEAVALFNRQNEIQITIANRTDEARCINGVFWADDPAGFARLLEVSLGLTMAQQGESIVLRGR